jgi:GlpG protein
MIAGFRPRFTYGLVAVCVLIALVTRFGADFDSIRPLLITNYVDAGLLEISQGQLWRLITPVFVHFGIMHLALNMLWLWQLGEIIEFTRGPRVLATLVLTSAMLSNVAEFYVSGPLFGGMSGVIFALLGYLWVQGKFNPQFPLKLNPTLVTMVMVWFVVCWSGVLQLIGIHIANWAHTVGLACGALLGLAAAKTGTRMI